MIDGKEGGVKLTSRVEGTVSGVGAAEVRVAASLGRGRGGDYSAGGDDEGSDEGEELHYWVRGESRSSLNRKKTGVRRVALV